MFVIHDMKAGWVRDVPHSIVGRKTLRLVSDSWNFEGGTPTTGHRYTLTLIRHFAYPILEDSCNHRPHSSAMSLRTRKTMQLHIQPCCASWTAACCRASGTVRLAGVVQTAGRVRAFGASSEAYAAAQVCHTY